MTPTLTTNTQAILLLTAPLLVGRRGDGPRCLSPREYSDFARRLREHRREPADLLGHDVASVLAECRATLEADRLQALLARGFQLSRAVEHWNTRAIWVISRADARYPRRLKARLKDAAPALLYGCGNAELLDSGGLAVVGSRDVDAEVLVATEDVGRRVAQVGRTLVSGGARGVDQAAMRGASESGGNVVGVLADRLERAVTRREHRGALMNGRLALISTDDPAADFSVGRAMQRNKLIYALADAGLVMNVELETGGTWAGAVEQLDKCRFGPVYFFDRDRSNPALAALRAKGAQPWPDPQQPNEFDEVLTSKPPARPEQASLPLDGE